MDQETGEQARTVGAAAVVLNEKIYGLLLKIIKNGKKGIQRIQVGIVKLRVNN
jgi:hypothetical protein